MQFGETKNRLSAAARGGAGALCRVAKHVINSPTTKRVAPVVAVVLFVCFVEATGVYAQSRGRGTFGSAARRLFDEYYDNWRGEFSLIAIAASGIALKVMGRRASAWIFSLLGGVLIVTMAPELRDFIEYLAGH